MVTVETMTSVADAIKLEQHDKSRLTSIGWPRHEVLNGAICGNPSGFLGGVLQGRWRRMDDKSLLGRKLFISMAAFVDLESEQLACQAESTQTR